MTPLEVATTVATALLSTHSAFYLPKTYAKLKTYFRIVQTVRNGLHMDQPTFDDLFNTAKACKAEAQTTAEAASVAAAKYKAARDAFYVKAAEEFGDIKS